MCDKELSNTVGGCLFIRTAFSSFVWKVHDISTGTSPTPSGDEGEIKTLKNCCGRGSCIFRQLTFIVWNGQNILICHSSTNIKLPDMDKVFSSILGSHLFWYRWFEFNCFLQICSLIYSYLYPHHGLISGLDSRSQIICCFLVFTLFFTKDHLIQNSRVTQDRVVEVFDIL